jgi:hypothetical protein
MQFRAVMSDVNVSTEGWLKVADVPCPSCLAPFRLFAPTIETERSEVALHRDWLGQHLMNTCPNHASDIRTPDPTLEKCRTYWLDEARAQAIQEAEDAGLRAAEREEFIRQHTEIYYAELVMRRVG